VSETHSLPDTQAEALLEELRRDQHERCRDLIQAAHAEAADLVRQAWRQARARMHQAVQEERNRFALSLRKAEAQLETEARRRDQAYRMHLLAEGWGLLQDALRHRWAQPAARRLWCAAVVEQALERLLAGRWQIEHPAGWDPAELGDLARALGERAGGAPAFHARDDIQAGLRIRAGGACLDGTIRGLLVDRSDIEGRLLAEFDRAAETEPRGAESGE
jgi:hypothetical protein